VVGQRLTDDDERLPLFVGLLIDEASVGTFYILDIQLRILYRSGICNKSVSTNSSSFIIDTNVVDSKSTNDDFDSLVRINELNEQLNVEKNLFAKRIC
jgi:hypothetical protein